MGRPIQRTCEEVFPQGAIHCASLPPSASGFPGSEFEFFSDFGAGSEQLPEDQRSYGRLLEGVADRVSDASRYLDERDVNALTRDVKRVARDHSAAFLGGAFVLGMVGARFLKSSPDEVRSGRDEWSGGRYGHDLPRGLPEPGMPTGPRLPDQGLPEPRGLDDSLEGGRDARGI
jgi:hypothetical protein